MDGDGCGGIEPLQAVSFWCTPCIGGGSLRTARFGEGLGWGDMG